MPPAAFSASIAGDDVALSTTAAVILVADHTASRSEPAKYVVQNNSAIDVTVGGPDVAAGSNGILLPGNTNASVTLHLTNPGESVYAIAASGTPSVQVTRVG